jgi:K+-transporting ATPase c subunit
MAFMCELKILTIIESIRNNPDKFAPLIYHECDNNIGSSTIIAEHFNRQYYFCSSSSSHTNDQRQGHFSSNYFSKAYMNIIIEEADKLFNKLARETNEEIINYYVGKQFEKVQKYADTK